MADKTADKEVKRRQYGTGSVHQRTSDLRWIGTIEAGWNANGSRRRITVTAATKKLVGDKLKRKLQELAAEGAPVAGISARATVKQWADKWLGITVTTLRPNAYTSNASAVNQWIIPVIGHKRIEVLTPGDIRAVATAIRAAGRSSSTAHRTHTTMIKMLRDAMIEGHRVPPRLLEMSAPARAKSDRDAIPLHDALALLKTAAEHPSGVRWVAGFLEGMRQGETLGLTWAAIDFTAHTIDVSWQLQDLPYVHGCGTPNGRRYPCGRAYGGDCTSRGGFRTPDGYEMRHLEGAYHLVRPKTNSGQRIIPLVPWLEAGLLAWQEVAPYSKHGLVFCRLDGRPIPDRGDRADWHKLQDRAQVARVDDNLGRRYKVHEMRHTAATLLLSAGVDPEVIQAILGHSDQVAQKGYKHVNLAMARKALEDVASKLNLHVAIPTPALAEIEAAAS